MTYILKVTGGKIEKVTKFDLANKIKFSNWNQMRIKNKFFYELNIILLINFLNEKDKLLKSRNQIIWIKQQNLSGFQI